MGFPQVTLELPDWVEELIPDPGRTYPTEEDRMRLVVELSRLNVERGTGGPFGARDEDVRAVGIDEGAKLPDWAEALEERGIAVKRDVLRGDAARVLRHYANSAGEIYNARQGD